MVVVMNLWCISLLFVLVFEITRPGVSCLYGGGGVLPGSLNSLSHRQPFPSPDDQQSRLKILGNQI